jgi:pyrroloquinoline quinone (PQQ) biosynthesis protein C
LVAIPIVGELFGPESSRAYLAAFRDRYGATDTRYFDVHMASDEEHGDSGRLMLEGLARTEAARAEINEVVDVALDAFWGFYDSIYLYATTPTYPL